MGFLYQDLNESCLSQMQTQYKQEKAVQADFQPPAPEPATPSDRIAQRKQKTKPGPIIPQYTTYRLAPAPQRTLIPNPV